MSPGFAWVKRSVLLGRGEFDGAARKRGMPGRVTERVARMGGDVKAGAESLKCTVVL